MRSISCAIRSVSSGGTRTAAFPPTSGSDAAVDVMTGVPQAMASSTGRPKPYKLGNANSRAALYQSGNSSSGT